MFECKYCSAKFIRESAYVKHKCKEMERYERARTPRGLAAYQVYCKWMRTKRRTPMEHEMFHTSPMFNAFYDFHEFATKAGVVVDVYIEVVARIDLHPSHWMRNEAYALYLEHVERTQDPHLWIQNTMKLLMKYADALDCDTAEVIMLLQPSELMELVRKRQLSPWVLLHSFVFKQWLTKLNKDEQQLVQELIRPVYWKVRFDRDPNMVKLAKKYVAAAGL